MTGCRPRGSTETEQSGRQVPSEVRGWGGGRRTGGEKTPADWRVGSMGGGKETNGKAGMEWNDKEWKAGYTRKIEW